MGNGGARHAPRDYQSTGRRPVAMAVCNGGTSSHGLRRVAAEVQRDRYPPQRAHMPDVPTRHLKQCANRLHGTTAAREGRCLWCPLAATRRMQRTQAATWHNTTHRRSAGGWGRGLEWEPSGLGTGTTREHAAARALAEPSHSAPLALTNGGSTTIVTRAWQCNYPGEMGTGRPARRGARHYNEGLPRFLAPRRRHSLTDWLQVSKCAE